MKKILAFLLLFTVALDAAPRGYGKSGTATNVNATVTFSFNPATFVVCNDSTSVDFYIDWTDGVAAAVDDSTNVLIKFSECHSFPVEQKSVSETFTVGIITAASTAAYRMEGIR